jgi:hypothetical protein
MHPLQTTTAIEQDIANLEREKAALDAQIAVLKKAQEMLRPGGSVAAEPPAVNTVVSGPPQTHFDKVVAFLKSCASVPQTIAAIAKVTGLETRSVARVLYRTRQDLFDRQKIQGGGVIWRLKEQGGATVQKRGRRPASTDQRPDRYELVVAILKDARRPLTAPEIAAEVEKRGEGHGANSLRDIVHSVLRRKAETFRKVEENGRVAFTLREPEGRAPKESQSDASGPEMPRGLGPSDAILYFLERHPGATREGIMRALEERVATSSTNRKNLLGSMIRYLEQTRKIMHTAGGKYYLVPQPEGVFARKHEHGGQEEDRGGSPPDA